MNATVVINDKKYETTAGRSILDVCEENNIDIPTVCIHPYIEPKGSSWMSVVEVRDVGLTPARTTCVGDGMEVMTHSKKVIEARKKVLKGMLARHYGDCIAPCTEACPAHIDIQGYLSLITRGETTEALELIREMNPLPSTIGRICPRPCETACRRSLVDQSLAICWLKRYCADKGLLLDGTRTIRSMAPQNGIRVAVIGSGPAGLSAAFYLAKAGYEPVIFEALPRPGGMLRYGIPEYRLPKEEVLDREICTITDMGVEIRCNMRFGTDITFRSLEDSGYKAILLAVGCHKGLSLGIEGEGRMKKVFLGTDLLRDFALGNRVHLGKNVAVIGGGNTAMDAARTAIRLEGETVTVLYRRSRSEMPANVWEIEEAEQEGVHMHFLAAPVSLHGEDEALTAIRCVRMKLGEPDASGRRRPVPIQGSEFDLPVDSVISAIGQSSDLSFLNVEENRLADHQEISVEHGRIKVDESTMATNIPGIFSAGDSQRGAATAIEAIADGRKAALSIDQYIRTGKVDPRENRFVFHKVKQNSGIDQSEFSHVERHPRAHMFCLRPNERRDNFKEIEQGFDARTAREEASRCLECGCRAADYCVLRDLADELAVQQPERESSFAFVPPIRSHMVERDPNKCIQCGLCDEVCRSVMNVGALGRGYGAGIPPQWDKESLCVSCGHCIEVCPVGAIVFNSSVKPSRVVDTLCPYCGVGCKLNLELRGNFIIKARADLYGPANLGMACLKGRFGLEFVNHPNRLRTPLIRKDRKLVSAFWHEALELIADRFGKYKGDRFGLFASAKCTNEENYLMQKFARAVQGTNNVDHCARLCHASTVAGLATTLGSGAMTNSIAEIEQAACIFVIGSNTTEAHPVIGAGIKRAARNASRLIVANPKRIELCNYASLFIQHRLGTDVALIMGMLYHIFEKGLENKVFIQERTEDLEDFMASLKAFDLDTVEDITHVSKSKIASAAEIYATSETSSIVYSMGITQHSHGTENVFALSNLALATGQIGRLFTGINPLRGQNNVQGACDMGALPNVFPGYQPIIDHEIQEKFRKAWGVTTLDDKIGMTVTEMMGPKGEERLKALYIIGENPAMSEPDCTHVRKILEGMEFLVVQDIFLTETAQLADVVLPGATFAEKDGTFTNTERRVQRLDRALPPLSGKTDWEIVCMLAKKMGAKGFYFKDTEEIMKEIASVAPIYGGISHNRLSEKGLQWPCPDVYHLGTPYLHKDKFTRGRARFMPLKYRSSEEPPDADYPFMLTTGRNLFQFHTGTMSRKNITLNQMLSEEQVEIHPSDAAKIGVSSGDRVKVSSRRGEISARVHVTSKLQPGLVFMTFHFAEACANVLTNRALDPVAKIPEFKVCAVKLEKC